VSLVSAASEDFARDDEIRVEENHMDPNENTEGTAQALIAEDSLVEEVSIDGMCGVY